jgi:autotransporter strand-loop-strand O-heptosyltransferase
MKIAQITPGLISIPPNGWGAIEKIIWNYKNSFEENGNQCDIKYLNEIKKEDYDIVHIHVANLAIEAKDMGIPYIFSLHDHHVYRFGKDSEIYKQNLEAIKGSVISFTHAEFLVDYFEDTDKLFYLSHGVDINYFTKTNRDYGKEHVFRLLCVANNGYSDDQSYDRKGFRYAIEAAKKLNLPITIVGPSNNLNFFNENKELLEYKKLNLITDNISEEKLLKIYKAHDIFLHPSELEAGHPNLTLLEAISCSMPIVGVYDGNQKIKSLVNCYRDVESVSNGIIEIIENYNKYYTSVSNGIIEIIENYNKYYTITFEDREKFSWNVISLRLLNMYKSIISIKEDCTNDIIKNKYKNSLKNIKKNSENKIQIKEKVKIKINFVNGATVNIEGNSTKLFKVQFWDCGKCVFETEISSGQWCKPNKKYFTNWEIKVYSEDNLIYDYKIDLNNKRVYIAIDSSSIGDNVAWIPYLEEFRKKHNCKLVVSTFLNDLFKNSYKDIEFVTPGFVVEDLYAMYTVGCFYDSNLEPELSNTIPLQKVATNILGLEHKEIKPIINFNPSARPYLSKYVVIAPHSTAGLKYWNNETGWQEVVDYLLEQGYTVINVSREGCNLRGVKSINNYSMNKIMNTIYHSEFFLGLSSGLSWIAWSLGKHVFMISNFTDSKHEFSSNCTRIINKDVCNSCWVDPNFRFDKGDWNWCPKHKGTDRQFECSKSITGNMVIEKINLLINV